MDLQKMAEKLGLPGQDPSLMIGEGIGFVTNLLLYIYIYNMPFAHSQHSQDDSV